MLAITYAISATAVFMAGCSGNMDHMGDEPEFTADFLCGEYATQLVRDGATVIFGAILDVTEDEEGVTVLEIGEREYVDAPNHPDGFFIADKNLESVYQLSSGASATFLSGSTSIAKAMGAVDFAAADHTDKLYDIYIMGDQIELLIARYIP